MSDDANEAGRDGFEDEERNRGAITWRQFDRLVTKFTRTTEDSPDRRGRAEGEFPRIDRQRSDYYAVMNRKLRLLGGASFEKKALQDLRREVDAMWPHAIALATEVRVLQEVYPLMSDWAESQEVSWLASEVEDAVSVMEQLRDRLVELLDGDDVG